MGTSLQGAPHYKGQRHLFVPLGYFIMLNLPSTMVTSTKRTSLLIPKGLIHSNIIFDIFLEIDFILFFSNL